MLTIGLLSYGPCSLFRFYDLIFEGTGADFGQHIMKRRRQMKNILKKLSVLLTLVLVLGSLSSQAFATGQRYKITVYKNEECTQLASAHAQEAFIRAEKDGSTFKVITHKKISGPPPFSWMKGEIESLKIDNVGQGRIENSSSDPRVFIFDNVPQEIPTNSAYKAEFRFSVGVIHPKKTVYLKFTPIR